MAVQAEDAGAARRRWMIWLLVLALVLAAAWGIRRVAMMQASQPTGDCIKPRPDTSLVGSDMTEEDCEAQCPECTWRG